MKALYNAAKRGRHPRRDETIILFLLDTGMRPSELVNLCRKDIDLQTKKCTVMGKGNKTRPVYYGQQTAKTLYSYLSERKQQHGKDMLPDEPLFLADRGTHKGERMTRNGLGQLITRLGEFAEIEKTRCSPHTFRHTFAVEFLRSGGNQFSLMQLLGHTNIQMTSKYVALAQGDVENQHRMHSPGDRLRKK